MPGGEGLTDGTAGMSIPCMAGMELAGGGPPTSMEGIVVSGGLIGGGTLLSTTSGVMGGVGGGGIMGTPVSTTKVWVPGCSFCGCFVLFC